MLLTYTVHEAEDNIIVIKHEGVTSTMSQCKHGHSYLQDYPLAFPLDHYLSIKVHNDLHITPIIRGRGNTPRLNCGEYKRLKL